MKITIATDQGEVIAIIKNVEEYNLAKPLGRASLMDEIVEAVEEGNRLAALEDTIRRSPCGK